MAGDKLNYRVVNSALLAAPTVSTMTIWARLREKHPEYPIAEVTERQYVQKRIGRAGGVRAAELRLVPGGTGDWFEAVAKLEHEPSKLSSSQCAACVG